MSKIPNAPADSVRRHLLGAGGAAALALGTAGTARAAGRPATPTYGITRTRYTTAAAANLPTAGDTYVLPLAAVMATDGNGDSTLNADNTITINTTGLYRVMLSVDWVSGKGHDVALRSFGLRRRTAGGALTTAAGGDLILVPDTDQHLGSEDHPGSAAPEAVRFPAPPDGAHDNPPPFFWTPGTLALGGYASIDVTMPVTGIVAPGDIAMASLSSAVDSVIGGDNAAALIVSAKVIAADVVRVTIFNPSIAAGITIPRGHLQVLGFNATVARGGSGEARAVLNSAAVPLAAGDKIYAVFSSLFPGDSMQSSSQVFLQVEKWTQTS